MNLEDKLNDILFQIGKEVKIHRVSDKNIILDINYEKYTKQILDLFKVQQNFRGIPTPVCPCCGSNLLRVTVQFDPDTYEISGYLLDDAQCMECKCLITAPTPLDHPDYI